jgi:hypothetical protein
VSGGAVTRGSCLCGAVTYRVAGPLRPVIACHCSQCRKQSGNFVAATAAPRAAPETEGGEAITWYAASGTARRGFCRTCGSQLFWQRNGADTVSIFAGTLDGPTGVKLEAHIHCADKGDFYEIADGLPQMPQGREPPFT